MCYQIVRLICKITVDEQEDEQEGVQQAGLYSTNASGMCGLSNRLLNRITSTYESKADKLILKRVNCTEIVSRSLSRP